MDDDHFDASPRPPYNDRDDGDALEKNELTENLIIEIKYLYSQKIF